MEQRINSRISSINTNLTQMNQELMKMQTHQDGLFDRFCAAQTISQRAMRKKDKAVNDQSDESEDHAWVL